MSDWIKSFIAGCIVFVGVIFVALAIIIMIIYLVSVHFLIVPVAMIIGILTLLTIIMHARPKPQENK